MATPRTAVESLVPQNVDAEKSVLGAILLDNSQYNNVAEIIRPEEFLIEAHQHVFRAIGLMLDRSQPADLLTITAELGKQRLLERVGGPAYISSLVDGIPRIINARHYAAIVKEKALLRGILTLSQRMRDGAVRGDRTPEDLLEESMGELFRISEGRASGGFLSIREILGQTYRDADALYDLQAEATGINTGFIEFDEISMGLHPANLIILAARPSVGKTSFCLNICENISIKKHKSVGFFSLEMSREELALRLLCSEARVNLQQLRRKMISREERASLGLAFGALLDAPIYIDDTPQMTVTEMRAKSRRLRLEHGLDLVIVDHMQLIQGSGRPENRNQELSAISRSLKGLSKELNIPVICISQLSRAPEGRTDKRPMLSDLRESGAIEQDADMVAFLYRDELYNPNEENRGIAELIVGKNRNGPAGSTVRLAFMAQYTRFENFSYEQF